MGTAGLRLAGVRFGGSSLFFFFFFLGGGVRYQEMLRLEFVDFLLGVQGLGTCICCLELQEQ